jgi:hypothetical protein
LPLADRLTVAGDVRVDLDADLADDLLAVLDVFVGN